MKDSESAEKTDQDNWFEFDSYLLKCDAALQLDKDIPRATRYLMQAYRFKNSLDLDALRT